MVNSDHSPALSVGVGSSPTRIMGTVGRERRRSIPVATLVNVTGIVIYFSVAICILRGTLL